MSDQQAGGMDASRVEVLAVIDRFRDLLWSRDPAMADEFADDADILLVGSDADEVARGPDAVRALIRGLFALPVRLRWDWQERVVSVAGDTAWFFAACHVVAASRDGEARKPYRMTGILQRTHGRWRWRQFHGSQPAN